MNQLPRICDEYKQYKNIIIFGASTLGAVAFTAIKNSVNVKKSELSEAPQ